MITLAIPVAVRGHGFFLEPADREHAPAQRDLARHGGVAANRPPGERADHRRGDRDARRRAVLRRRAGRDVHVQVAAAMEVTIDA